MSKSASLKISAASLVLLACLTLPAMASKSTSAPAGATTPSVSTVDETSDESSTGTKTHMSFDQKMQKMHDDLKLSKDQDSSWTKVSQAMQENHAQMSKMSADNHAKGNENAVDKMKYKQASAQAKAEGLSKFNAAFEPFYNSLSADQKKKADGYFARTSHHHASPMAGMAH